MITFLSAIYLNFFFLLYKNLIICHGYVSYTGLICSRVLEIDYSSGLAPIFIAVLLAWGDRLTLLIHIQRQIPP